jgi:hypothetical protein
MITAARPLSFGSRILHFSHLDSASVLSFGSFSGRFLRISMAFDRGIRALSGPDLARVHSCAAPVQIAAWAANGARLAPWASMRSVVFYPRIRARMPCHLLIGLACAVLLCAHP